MVAERLLQVGYNKQESTAADIKQPAAVFRFNRSEAWLKMRWDETCPGVVFPVHIQHFWYCVNF